MKKFLNKIKQNDYLIYTFLTSIIIIGIIYKLQEVAPFGENSLLKIDFFHQYGPMLAELYDRIHSGESLLYTFNTGLGLPFFRNFFNYLASPFNIIIFLFKRENLLLSYSILIGIKAALSATTMTYYLKKKINANKYLLIGLGLLYAFSAYFCAFYWNIMWTDGMIFLPLITLGIENIIDKQKGLLYTLSLAIMLYTNYFIGYMICIFSVIYFISYSIIKKVKFKKFIKYGIKFAICSLTAGMLVAWALIPMFESLMSTSATGGTMPLSQYYDFTIIEFIKNHITGVIPSVLASDITNSPNVSCGILSVILFLSFIFNNNINFRKKLIYSSILMLLLISFYIAPLDYIWHAFHVPNDLPYRYSFIYTFIMIIISGYALKNIKKISLPKAIIIYIICILYLTFIKITNFPNVTNKILNINYILLTTYFLIYTLYKLYPKYKKISIILTIIVISLECIISINNNWDIAQNIDDFYYSYNDTNNSIKTIKNKEEELFYRTEKNNILTFNDGAWYDYYGLTTFTSMAYDSLAKLNNELGQPGNNINSYYYKQNTPIYDLMFNIKYTIGYNEDTTRYEKALNENGTLTYKFKYTTGLMFGVNKATKKWKYNYINPLEYQNDFIKNATNIENTLYRLTLRKREIIEESEKETIVKYTYENENDNIYIYSNNNLINYIVIDDAIYYKKNIDTHEAQLKLKKNLSRYRNYDETYVINRNINSKYIDIYISYSKYLNEEADVYTINNNKFLKAYETLKEKEVKITEFNENEIVANIDLDENTLIYTSIPYDKGWKVYVNNKKINTIALNDSLLAFNLNKGKNNIVLKYTPNNMDIGLCISISTIIFGLTYLIIKKKTNHQ